MSFGMTPGITPEDRRLLRDAFGTFMTGVTVVTTSGPDGRAVGFTANSFSSVSLDPPLLLVSIARSSSNFQRFASAKGFAINILSETQREVSNTFARPSEDRFAKIGWSNGPHGAPILAGVSAWFDCSLHQWVEAGDHAILIGKVEAFNSGTAPGLGYYRGTYFTPAEVGAAVSAGPAVVISAISERDGQVLLLDAGAGGLTLPSVQVGREGATAALHALIAACGVEAAPGFIYSVFEDAERGLQHIAFLCPATAGPAIAGTPRQGRFCDLAPGGLGKVTDPAQRIMLERLSEENRVGNYGVYFGTQNTGTVRKVTKVKTR